MKFENLAEIRRFTNWAKIKQLYVILISNKLIFEKWRTMEMEIQMAYKCLIFGCCIILQHVDILKSYIYWFLFQNLMKFAPTGAVTIFHYVI